MRATYIHTGIGGFWSPRTRYPAWTKKCVQTLVSVSVLQYSGELAWNLIFRPSRSLLEGVYVCLRPPSVYVCMYVCLRQLSMYVCMSQTYIHTYIHTYTLTCFCKIKSSARMDLFKNAQRVMKTKHTYMLKFLRNSCFRKHFKHVCMFQNPSACDGKRSTKALKHYRQLFFA